MKYIWCCFLLLLGGLPGAFAQRQIQGELQTNERKAISYANVTIKDQHGRVVAFKATDSEGYFAILLPDSVDVKTVVMEVRHLGYKTVRKTITETQKYYKLLMEEQQIDLSEVEVKSPPRIDRRGDTLLYDVHSFTKNEDRSIGDVIRRMPGMEVGDNGEIKFNGKSISHFYIDGDDLLSDKYAIGSKTIPHDMVKGVEVLQNHQPIKVLQDKVSSHDVAINLVIKDEAKVKMSGQAKIGAGLPRQYDEELNAILFNKRYKLLNVAKANNVGEDLSSDFTAFNRASFLSAMGNKHPDALLSTGTAGGPALPKNRFYINNSGSLNANNLMHLKNGLQLKSTVNLLLDESHVEYDSRNELYLEKDTVRYAERQASTRKPFITDVIFNAEDNQKSHYLKDELRFAYSGYISPSTLQMDNLSMNQQLEERVRDFSNLFQYVPQLRNKNIITLSWYANYFNRPQTLSISPGIYPELLHDSLAYNTTKQVIETPAWFNKASLAYGLVKGFIKQEYGIGIVNERQQLGSDLRVVQFDGTEHPVRGDEIYHNDLYWKRNRFYADASYGFKKDRIDASLKVPLAWQEITYRDQTFDLDTAKRQWLFNPSFRMQIRVGTEDFIALNYVYANQLGDIDRVYRGAVLTNYRSLMANRAGLWEEKGYQIGMKYNFQRSVALLFLNAGINWNKTTADAMLSRKVSDQMTQTVLIPLPNNVSTFSAYGEMSKYIFDLGATAAVKASWSTARFNQLLNQSLLPYVNNTFSMSPRVETQLWKGLSIAYHATATWTASKLIAGENSTSLPEQAIQVYDQSFALKLTPSEKWLIDINGRHLLTLQKKASIIRYFFADAHVRYSMAKWHSDIELNLTNLANIKTYESYNLSANQFWYNRYLLRGRMAVLKYTFNIR